jgi:KDO2-lipid IV(A) lauroyltransferase
LTANQAKNNNTCLTWRLNVSTHMFFIRLISKLPFRVLYALSDFLFFASYRVIGYRRKMVMNNLRNSFPEKTEQELHRIEKQFYKNLCDYGVEMLKLFTISREQLAKRMVFTNPEIVLNHLKNNQSVIFLASHQFNWEWLLTGASLVYPSQIDFVYQRVNSEFFNNFSLESRTRFGAHAIQRDEVARESFKRRNLVRGIALVADQYPGYDHDKKYFTKFLNQDTVFFNGTSQLGIMLQYPVIYHAVRKVRRGYYETTAFEIARPPYAKDSTDIISNYVRAVERVIQENPSGWLWSHNRWKTRHLKQETQ